MARDEGPAQVASLLEQGKNRTLIFFARVEGIEPPVQLLESCGLPLTDTRIL